MQGCRPAASRRGFGALEISDRLLADRFAAGEGCRAAVRFASAEERQLSDSPLLLPALWCAKETLYKYSGRRNLDLLRDLRIERFDPDEGRMTGRICGESALEIGLRREEELLAAYILV